jgi:L-ascorbate metabolism protein UlaG (beta-lactamase superfamily)
MILKWLGHASFLIKTLGKNVFIDPYVGDYSEKADIILVTHGHRDHCDLEKIAAIKQTDTIMVTSQDCSHNLTGNIIAVSPGDKKEIFDIGIEAVESYNYKRFRSPGVPFHPEGTQIGFMVSAENKNVYHTGDSDFIPSMKELKDVDVALIPIMGRAMMDLEEAVEATVAINPKIAIPMHRYSRNQPDIGGSAEEFKKRVEADSDVRVLAIEEGDEVDLSIL